MTEFLMLRMKPKTKEIRLLNRKTLTKEVVVLPTNGAHRPKEFLIKIQILVKDTV